MKKFTFERVIPEPSLPVYAAVAPWSEKDNTYYFSLLYSVGQAYGFELKTPWNKLTELQQKVLLLGSDKPILIQADSRFNTSSGFERPFEGILNILERQLNETNGESLRQKLEKYLELVPCKTCAGKRLRPEALAVKVGPYAITDLTSISVLDTLTHVEKIMGCLLYTSPSPRDRPLSRMPSSA